jgi:lipid-A-disaccharide synthase
LSLRSAAPPTIGIVANEPSGDLLGAGLIQAVRERLPDARFEGVGGPQMLAEGCRSLLPMEELAVMGLVEVLSHLPRLLAIRRRLVRHFLSRRPSVLVGIDAPDFNLGLERRLRRVGIPTVHYVSPTVWAWRPGRVRHIRRSTDLLLSIFPFEVPFLERHGVPVRYVGHPLADLVPLEPDRVGARARLGLPREGLLVAVLPGSRLGEVRLLAREFLEAADWCRQRRPQLRFITPLVSRPIRELVEQTLRELGIGLPITLVDGSSHDCLAAADLVLTASGTATLESLLYRRPMVVGYRLHPLTYRLAAGLRLVKVPYVALANLLAGEELAPELLQDACRAPRLGQALLGLLEDPQRVAQIQVRYGEIHLGLRCDSSRRAAEAVLDLLALNGDPR